MIGDDRLAADAHRPAVVKGADQFAADLDGSRAEVIIVAVVLGAADHSSRYEDMRTILAALPRDFSELAEPVAGAARRKGNASCP